jgi:hypothetical protein
VLSAAATVIEGGGGVVVGRGVGVEGLVGVGVGVDFGVNELELLPPLQAASRTRHRTRAWGLSLLTGPLLMLLEIGLRLHHNPIPERGLRHIEVADDPPGQTIARAQRVRVKV